MGTIRIFFMIAVAITGLALAPPVLAQDQEHDWKISEILGWYTRLSDVTNADIEVHVEKDAITTFNRTSSTWTKRQGTFEKLSQNRFILTPDHVINEKGSNLLAIKGWCNHLRVEIFKWHRFEPGKRTILTLDYFLSPADLRASENRCGGLSYTPIDPPTEKPAN